MTIGFEGLTLDTANDVLYAMLQEATIQDGGSVKTTAQFTRMVAYDIADATTIRPTLVGEWVVPLPVSTSKNTVRACSEIHFVSENVFFALSRDGNGNGDGDTASDTLSKYKSVSLFFLSDSTLNFFSFHIGKQTYSASPEQPTLLVPTLTAHLPPLRQMVS